MNKRDFKNRPAKGWDYLDKLGWTKNKSRFGVTIKGGKSDCLCTYHYYSAKREIEFSDEQIYEGQYRDWMSFIYHDEFCFDDKNDILYVKRYTPIEVIRCQMQFYGEDWKEHGLVKISSNGELIDFPLDKLLDDLKTGERKQGSKVLSK